LEAISSLQGIRRRRFSLAWISGCGLSGALLALTDQILLTSLDAATSIDALAPHGHEKSV
jgi:hypothetical protein